METPRHSDEWTVFEDFRELDDATGFVRLFNEHTGMDRTFNSRTELDRFISNDYPNMSEKEQAKFVKEMETALTDYRNDFEKTAELLGKENIDEENLSEDEDN